MLAMHMYSLRVRSYVVLRKLTVTRVLIRPNFESAYDDMAKHTKREEEAVEWAETTFKDVAPEQA
jgi:hypothetical protein